MTVPAPEIPAANVAAAGCTSASAPSTVKLEPPSEAAEPCSVRPLLTSAGNRTRRSSRRRRCWSAWVPHGLCEALGAAFTRDLVQAGHSETLSVRLNLQPKRRSRCDAVGRESVTAGFKLAELSAFTMESHTNTHPRP